MKFNLFWSDGGTHRESPAIMDNQYPYSFFDEESRQDSLNSLIEGLFGHLAPDEVNVLASEYSKSETRMLEVTHVTSRTATLMDLYEDIEFKSVRFPKELLPLLRESDVFQATLGRNGSHWVVLHLSPSYEVIEEYLH